MNLARILDFILKLDRRVIYTILFVCVIFPFYVDWPHIRVDVSKEVEDSFQLIDAIPPGGHPLLMSFDYDPASGQFTQTEFLDLVKKAKAKGITPMSQGVGDRPYPGSYITHEALLKKLGPKDYDALMKGSLSWSDPRVV